MLSNIQMMIIKKAVKIRIDAGENMEDILSSYLKLTDEERTAISQEFTPKEIGE